MEPHAIALVLAVTATVTLVAAPASAAPPVAQDDHRSMYAGSGRAINVLRNDSDPDGDELAVCRVADVPDDADYHVFIDENRLVVFTGGNLSGDITITYYACDFETLAPATLTISIKEIYRPKVVKAARPGRIRVTNDNDRAILFLYGNFREERPDGRARVEGHDSVVIRVHRHRIDWVAFLGREIIVGIGHVRGIELPAHSIASDQTVTLTPAEARAWARAGRR